MSWGDVTHFHATWLQAFAASANAKLTIDHQHNSRRRVNRVALDFTGWTDHVALT
jgi:hypothetical protein